MVVLLLVSSIDVSSTLSELVLTARRAFAPAINSRFVSFRSWQNPSRGFLGSPVSGSGSLASDDASKATSARLLDNLSDTAFSDSR